MSFIFSFSQNGNGIGIGINGGNDNGYHVNGYVSNANGNGSMMTMGAKKPISPEVANLTAKNYRLAKELVVYVLFYYFEAFCFLGMVLNTSQS